MSTPYLHGLNDAQSRAVLHPPDIPLQILAGPGSGKTKVLTSRIVHLIMQHAIHPSAICAVTFTNKAANEMRERLTKMLGKHDTSQIKMGTFHALCASFLRRYAKDVGLEGNFTVCDADESKKIIIKLLKAYKDFLEDRNVILKEGTVISSISKAKAKGHTPDDLLKEWAKNKRTKGYSAIALDIQNVVAHVYKDYNKALRRNNSLDFDDLLVFGVKLFSEHKKSVAWCRHVLVDEFQDTNTMQYDLMLHLAATNKCVTIVGDPDQSIYGWRSAEVENLGKMQKDFPRTKQIFLEQNYRSTAAVLAASIAIVDQDKTRIPKTLHTTHPTGPLPVLKVFPHEQAEAAFIAGEIKRLAASMGGLLNWSDFVVLLRFNALSRSVESALQKEGIPCRVLAGHKFFERLEVKDLLAYLQLVDNPTFVPAFTRAINVPPRALGEKTVAELLATAERLKLSPLAAAERIHDGELPDIKPPARRKLAAFVVPIRRLRALANDGAAPSVLIRELLELIEYEAHLRKTQQDWESRWDNVQELLNFASEVERDLAHTMALQRDVQSADIKGKGRARDVEEEEHVDTPLRLFLQASMLSTDTETKDDEAAKEKVTISTCHAAKGLEWPVVMIPAVERGTFPSSRAEDIEEERRLLYVACTRAQGLLYLSHCTSRMVAGETRSKDLSEFVWAVLKGDRILFADQLPELQQRDRALVARVLRRPPPEEAEVARRIEEYKDATSGREDIHGIAAVNALYKSVAQPPAIQQPALASFQGSSAFFSAKPSLALVPEKLSSAKPLSRAALSPSPNHGVNAGPSRVSPSSSPPATERPSKRAVQPQQYPSTKRTLLTLPSKTHAPIAYPAVPRSLPVKSLTADSPSLPSSSSCNARPAAQSPAQRAGGKRRLGMGRTAVGYPNKKFKTPGSGA